MSNENGEKEEEIFGLCCFNGCKNECLKKTCKTVEAFEATETETTFEEKCTDGFIQECHDETFSKCEMVIVNDDKKHETILECKNVTETIDVTKTECTKDIRQECKPVLVSKCQKGTDKMTLVTCMQFYNLVHRCCKALYLTFVMDATGRDPT